MQITTTDTNSLVEILILLLIKWCQRHLRKPRGSLSGGVGKSERATKKLDAEKSRARGVKLSLDRPHHLPLGLGGCVGDKLHQQVGVTCQVSKLLRLQKVASVTQYILQVWRIRCSLSMWPSPSMFGEIQSSRPDNNWTYATSLISKQKHPNCVNFPKILKYIWYVSMVRIGCYGHEIWLHNQQMDKTYLKKICSFFFTLFSISIDKKQQSV